MYKNQLQELAQRSCFNLPSYTCIREGPDHAPRFKASVNFNGDTYESPSYCSTLRQAEHSAAEVALNALAGSGPTSSLAARILDETGVYKNLLQEVSQRVGGCMPSYTTFRSGQGHLPVFTCTVELVGVIFMGDPAKNKKQAEKNAAMVAWLSLKSLVQQSQTPYEKTHKDEQEHVTVARTLQKYLIKARLAKSTFPIKFPSTSLRPSCTHHSSPTTSKILPLICPKTAGRSRPSRPTFPAATGTTRPFEKATATLSNEPRAAGKLFPAASAPPYIPVRHCNPHGRIAPHVTVRNMVPVFAAPPAAMRPLAPPVSIRPAIPVYAAAAPACKEGPMPIMVHPHPVTADDGGCRGGSGGSVPNSAVSSDVLTVEVGPPVSPRAATYKTRIESKEIEDLKI